MAPLRRAAFSGSPPSAWVYPLHELEPVASRHVREVELDLRIGALAGRDPDGGRIHVEVAAVGDERDLEACLARLDGRFEPREAAAEDEDPAHVP